MNLNGVFMSRMKSHSRRLRADRQGAVAFEFALITPLLIGLVLGGMEYSFVLFGYSSMQLGADMAARAIAVNDVPAANVVAEVKSKMPFWMQSAPGLTITQTQTNAVDPLQNVIRVEVSAPASSLTPVPLFTNAFGWTITTAVAVGQERPF